MTTLTRRLRGRVARVVPRARPVGTLGEVRIAVTAWVGIHGCRNCIYDRKIDDSVVDLFMKLAQFWYYGHVSKSLVSKSTTAMNPNPGLQICFQKLHSSSMHPV